MTKSGANFTKDTQKKCEYCPNMVWVHNKRARAVCPEWACQREDMLKQAEISNRQKQIRKEKKRNACNSEERI